MTHAYLGLAALDLTLALVGYGLLFCLGLVRRRDDVPVYLGLAFFAGWAVTGIVLSFGAMLGLDPDLPRVLGMVVLALALFLFARRLFPALPNAKAPPETSPLARIAALAGATVLVLTLVTALVEATKIRADMSWDAWDFWLPKASAIYHFHGLDTGLGGFTTFGNPEYPPLVPVMDAVSFHFMGGAYPWLVSFQRCLLLVGFVAALAALLRRVPGWVLYPLLAVLVLTPQVWGEMFTVLPDQTLAYLLSLAAVTGILWLEQQRTAWLVLATAFLAAAALTKAEGVLLGLLLAAVMLGAGLAVYRRHALAGLVLLLGPLAIWPWRLWLAHHHQPVTAKVYSWTDLARPDYLAGRLDRLTYATGHMVDLLVDSSRWSATLPLALAALIVLAPTLRELSAALGAWIVVAFLGLATVYWIGKPDVHWYVSTSASRVVSSLPIVAAAVLPLLLGIALERDRTAGGEARSEEPARTGARWEAPGPPAKASPPL